MTTNNDRVPVEGITGDREPRVGPLPGMTEAMTLAVARRLFLRASWPLTDGEIAWNTFIEACRAKRDEWRAEDAAATPEPVACNCGWGGVHDYDNPRCAANATAEPEPVGVVTPCAFDVGDATPCRCILPLGHEGIHQCACVDAPAGPVDVVTHIGGHPLPWSYDVIGVYDAEQRSVCCTKTTAVARWIVDQANTTQATAVTGADLISAERQRQVAREGFTAAHDDEHDKGELLAAAWCYMLLGRIGPGFMDDYVEGHWPWARSDWKPSTDPVRNLVKAGALIAADIDRRLRKLGA